jgi:hypothetical protein
MEAFAAAYFEVLHPCLPIYLYIYITPVLPSPATYIVPCFAPALRIISCTTQTLPCDGITSACVTTVCCRRLQANPGVFSEADTAYTLAFSVIMLNTDHFNPSIKEE